MIELVSSADVTSAQRRLRNRVLHTPVFERASFSADAGCEVHFKCENFQRTGSFKFRGATNALLQIDSTERQRGVVTHSSGNHGAALALAAREAHVPAWIIVPGNANPLKRAAIEAYGGTIVDCGETLPEREETVARVGEETGAHFIPPYDHPQVIAGQGTAALELRAAVPQLDEVWVPVGGGGLASGTILAMRDGGVRVVGVEPALADDAYWSLRHGRLEPQRPPKTMADGLRTSLGEITFALLVDYQLSITTVTEDEILSAQRMLWQRMKLVVEPSGAVPLAGLLNAVRDEPGRYRTLRVGVILSGGNVQFPL